jgi:hypothetical protein
MKKALLFFSILLLFTLVVAGQSTEKSVGSISKRYADIAEKARLCETDDDRGEYGDVVMNELTINTRRHQWRAVGIYGKTFKFFYKGGDSEQHMYPDQLVLVKTERKESSRNYSEEYLFSDTGALMFYFQKAENDDRSPAERRIYFSGIKAIRIIEDGKTRDRLTVEDNKTAKEILGQGQKIKTLFAQSIKL